MMKDKTNNNMINFEVNQSKEAMGLGEINTKIEKMLELRLDTILSQKPSSTLMNIDSEIVNENNQSKIETFSKINEDFIEAQQNFISDLTFFSGMFLKGQISNKVQIKYNELMNKFASDITILNKTLFTTAEELYVDLNAFIKVFFFFTEFSILHMYLNDRKLFDKIHKEGLDLNFFDWLIFVLNVDSYDLSPMLKIIKNMKTLKNNLLKCDSLILRKIMEYFSNKKKYPETDEIVSNIEQTFNSLNVSVYIFWTEILKYNNLNKLKEDKEKIYKPALKRAEAEIKRIKHNEIKKGTNQIVPLKEFYKLKDLKWSEITFIIYYNTFKQSGRDITKAFIEVYAKTKNGRIKTGTKDIGIWICRT